MEVDGVLERMMKRGSVTEAATFKELVIVMFILSTCLCMCVCTPLHMHILRMACLCM